MKQSFDLLPSDEKPIILALPDLDINDDNIKEVRTMILTLLTSFKSKTATTLGEKQLVNDGASIYIHTPSDNPNGKNLPLIYYIHGGGYILGNGEAFCATFQATADLYNAIVVGIDYRVAPEYRFPTAIQDCIAGLLWILDHADQYGIDKDRITIFGESAGGGLNASLCLYMRDKHKEVKIKNQILIYPMLDYRTSENPETYPNKFVGEYIWNHQTNQYGWTAYKGDQTISAEDMPYYSPAMATNLQDLPKTFIAVGSLDLFFEEDLDYAKHLSRAGVTVTVKVVGGAVHGFNILPGATATQFNAEYQAYLKSVL